MHCSKELWWWRFGLCRVWHCVIRCGTVSLGVPFQTLKEEVVWSCGMSVTTYPVMQCHIPLSVTMCPVMQCHIPMSVTMYWVMQCHIPMSVTMYPVIQCYIPVSVTMYPVMHCHIPMSVTMYPSDAVSHPVRILSSTVVRTLSHRLQLNNTSTWLLLVFVWIHHVPDSVCHVWSPHSRSTNLLSCQVAASQRGCCSLHLQFAMDRSHTSCKTAIQLHILQTCWYLLLLDMWCEQL